MRRETCGTFTNTLGRWMARLAIGLCLLAPAPAAAQPRATEAKPAAPRELKLFQLKYAAAKEVASVLRSVLQDGTLSLAIDERTNTVIVSASKETIVVAEALIAKLDEAAATTARDERRELRDAMQIRVVWLASGLAPSASDAEGFEKTAIPPPVDLQPVVEELEKLGLTNMLMVSQTVLRTAATGQFKSQGSVTLRLGSAKATESLPCELSISGAAAGLQGQRMQLSVRVTSQKVAQGGGRMFSETLVSVETEVATPPGHYVVLGVSPTRSITSAFVVQVTPVLVTPVDMPAGDKVIPAPRRRGSQ